MRQSQSKADPQILTPRELAILELIAEGYRDKEIVDRLCISGKMIKEDQIRIMSKLNARSITSALNCALEKGLISLYLI